MAESFPWENGEREYWRFPPQNLRGWDRCHLHGGDLGAGSILIGIDLQKHVTDTQGCPLAVGDHNLDVHHVWIVPATGRGEGTSFHHSVCASA